MTVGTAPDSGTSSAVTEDYFEILGLPIKPIDPDRLREIYKERRTAWFLRQFVPEFLTQARRRLKELEEAYDVLRDPRRQKAILRDYKLRQRASELQRDAVDIPEVPALPPATANVLPAVHRPKVIRKLIQIAETIVHRRKRPMTEPEIKTLSRIGFKLGLEYPDALRLVKQIAIDTAQSLHVRSKREELLDGSWPHAEEAR